MEEREQEREKELGKNCSTDHDARSNALSHKYRAESDDESLSRACNEWHSKSSTADIPFFLVTISSNSSVNLRNLRELEACQHNGQKVFFGFYGPCHLPNNPGCPLHNYLPISVQGGALERFIFSATMRTVVLQIWDCRLLEKLKYLFHKEGES
ncbi:ubiquitin-like modifier-activating enzyme atg7 isoform X1 [Capsicum annuum]|uniref:ubiquitin-like modifier-activating enzyme atg7 isoform X1 n=2 Tax=Capsicum annuum TaxID=4072 RepID=UPI001FB14DA6|nr:ubiquitin-like modifier-activating enzyme atg7 isoform X1 [Capsicum annuum]XP_047259993.1 ubiquitin-like modifier-activating enzyme atg7 isoform X1 [Capsicum annuum]XP_047259994.1 ubiquitin-like modifier-activating enzyme atg7 isoform X1 [Capsicum annuum]